MINVANSFTRNNRQFNSWIRADQDLQLYHKLTLTDPKNDKNDSRNKLRMYFRFDVVPLRIIS